MRKDRNFFLTTSDNEKYRLFVNIKRARLAQSSVVDRINDQREHKNFVTDINLKQIAIITHKSYSSVYNTYSSLIEELEQLTHRKGASIKRLFAVTEDDLFFYLVKKSHPYRFIMTILTQNNVSFEDFWKSENSSKATMLRHLQPLRDYAKTYDISFAYEPMRFQGDERKLRLFLSVVFWLATDGASWPFETVSEETARQTFRYSLNMLEEERPNSVTERVGMIYMAVGFLRIKSGHALTYDEQSKMMNYPIPNMFRDLELDDESLNTAIHSLDVEKQLGETANLFFLFNFAPVYILPDGQQSIDTIERFRHYNPAIYTLVTEFLEQLPYNVRGQLHMDNEEYGLLVANLLTISMSTLVLGRDFSYMVAQDLNLRLQMVPTNNVLRAQVKQTIDYIVYDRQLTALEPMVEQLSEAYYNNLYQYIYQIRPEVTVKVAPVIEQTVIGYIDLLVFLNAIPFVEIAQHDDALSDADVVISSAYLDSDDIGSEKPLILPWRLEYNNDNFGQLYSALRETWDAKVNAAREAAQQ